MVHGRIDYSLRKFNFSDDKTTHTHRLGDVETYILEVRIRCLDWPARSHDRNPIEHVWDLVIFSECSDGTSKHIPQKIIKNILQSLLRIIQAVTLAEGHTRN